MNQGQQRETFELHRITLNRSGIVEIEHSSTYQKLEISAAQTTSKSAQK